MSTLNDPEVPELQLQQQQEPLHEQQPQRDAPAFDFYCERWTHGTRLMTKVERCDYLDLLLHQWTSDGLPADLDILARLVGYRKGSQISPLVLEKFPVAADGKRRNGRLEEERVKQRERIRRKREGAAITNAKKQARKVAISRPGSMRPSPPENGSTLSDTLSVTDSERLAYAERIAERHDIVTPPPTTHLPPQNDLAASPPYPADGAGWPATEEQCRSLATSLGVDPSYAATLWLEHDSTGDYTRRDEHGMPRPILKFSNYLKFRWNCRSRKNDEATALEKTKAELRRQGFPQRGTASASAGSSSSRSQHPSSRSGGGGSDHGGSGHGQGQGHNRAAPREGRGLGAGQIPTDVRADAIKRY